MEQMLEALAKARRAEFGDDAKMPNPMRARLHEEIARVGAAEDEKVESRGSWLTMFWPRVTVAATLATLIVLVPAIWWNQSHPLRNTLAKASGESATESKVNLADNSQIKVEPAATPASEAGALASSTHVAQSRGATELPGEMAQGFDKEIAAAKSQAAPAAAPVAGADAKAKSDRMAAVAPPVAQSSSAGDLAMAQQFSQQSALQSFRNTAQVSRAANVLNTFQVQQEGSDIRVVDADGSTYTGKIEQSAKNAELDSRMTSRRDAAKQTQRYAAKPADETGSAAPQSYFRATGFNMSLKKTVVFEGNYAAPPEQQPAAATANDRERTEQNRDRPRIVGTVRVNGEAAVEVDAVAETPEPAETKKDEK